MTSTSFIKDLSTVFLLTLSFVSGCFLSYFIVESYYKKRIAKFKISVKEIVILKIQAQENLTNLAACKESNLDTISMYDKLFKDTLVEIASKSDNKLKDFVFSCLENYIVKKKAFYDKK